MGERLTWIRALAFGWRLSSIDGNLVSVNVHPSYLDPLLNLYLKPLDSQ